VAELIAGDIESRASRVVSRRCKKIPSGMRRMAYTMFGCRFSTKISYITFSRRIFLVLSVISSACIGTGLSKIVGYLRTTLQLIAKTYPAEPLEIKFYDVRLRNGGGSVGGISRSGCDYRNIGGNGTRAGYRFY
jgi:hypothetical protein